MKKEGSKLIVLFVIIFAFLILFSFIALAEENDTQETDETDKISQMDKAYSCLEDMIEDKTCESLSVEEQAFSLLAVGKCKSEMIDNSENDECWPSSECRLRDTALALLALDKTGSSTDDVEEWLLSKKKSPQDLIWYLEIDANEETKCKITYEGETKTITVGEDRKISGSAGTCLSLAEDNYWLKIKDTCYEKNFTISCNKDFSSALVYKKKLGSTIYIPSETESAPAEGTTKHQVNAFCFSTSSSCDYEGSLWATLALAKTSNDVSAFLPYLIALSDETENKKYFPSSFLYMITDYEEYFSDIIDKQKSSGYWEISDSNKKFYDTSLALLALYEVDAEHKDTAKAWLLEVQGEDGCWNNVRDTAFVLYSAWPKAVSAGEAGEVDYCTEYNYFCVAPEECSQEDTLDDYYCSGLSAVCCKTKPAEETCAEKEGIICKENEACTSAEVPASDGKCCLGSCIVQELTECEVAYYDCKYDCSSGEEEKAYSCGTGKVCCGAKTAGSSWWIWLLIILLIILIALVVLAIIFRNQFKIWLFRIKNKFKRGPAPTTTRPGPRFPPAPPSGARMMPRTRMFLPRQSQTYQPKGFVRKVISKTDKELEETLRKLREMSK